MDINYGATAGQGNAQIATNAIAPYASQLIGDTFDHTDDPNKAAQLLSHAVLGAIIAYMNGGDPVAGAASATASELASMVLAKELYPEAFDEDGNLVRSRLSEEQAQGIVAITNAIGALAGGITGGDAVNTSLGSFIGENAIKNNDLGATAIVLGIIALTAYANTPQSVDEELKEGLPLSFLNLPLDTIIVTVEMVQGLKEDGLSSEAIVLALAKKFKVSPGVAQKLYDGAESVRNGEWITTNESMSKAAMEYQSFITGKAAQESFLVNGVKFDGEINGILIDAKSGYGNFINKETGEFYEWFSGGESLLNQAQRQLSAANGMQIQWYFENESAMKVVQKMFNEQHIDIKLVYKAKK